MKNSCWYHFRLAAGLALVLTGCESPTPKPVGDGAAIDGSGDVIGSTGQGDMDSTGSVPETEQLNIKDGVAFGKWAAIRFDYDSAVIREGDRTLLEEIAKWCKDNSDKKLMVAGHSDERGTIEYNRALGQRRASAARDYLVRLGASPKQVGTVSYGEEQPADAGHNEDAWGKNRRDEFGIVK